jgi:hypothetical protein
VIGEPVALDCRDNLSRRQRLRDADPPGNGIDWVEVEPDGVTLTMTFIGHAPRVVLGNVRIDGRPGDPVLSVIEVRRCDEEDEELDDCVLIELDRRGTGDGYRVCLVEVDPDGRPSRRPLAGLDPRLACADLAFDLDCPSDIDCVDEACPPEQFEEPEISYLGKDYSSFRQLVLDRLALIMPDWTERHVPDVGVALVELLAYVGDGLSYEQDAVATEAYLDTARLRTSVRRHVRLIDYAMHDGVNARAWVHVTVSRETSLEPQEIRFITTPPGMGAGRAVEITEDDLRTIRTDAFETFEPVVRDRPIRLRQSQNEIRLYTWGQRECCLALGATKATLRDAFEEPREEPEPDAVRQGRPANGRKGAGSERTSDQPAEHDLEAEVGLFAPPRLLGLSPGDVIVFEEVRGARTGEPADADPSHRQAVRLTRVSEGYDAAFGVPVLEVEWSREDALTFPLCVTAVVGEDCRAADISVARGNIVLVDHGRWIDECDGDPELVCVPCPDLGASVCEDVPCTDRHAPSDRPSQAARFRPSLARSPVTIAETFPDPGRVAAGQAALLAGLPDRVERRLREIWGAVRETGELDATQRDEVRTIFGDRALVEAGLAHGGAADGDPVAAIGWLLGRKERLLDRKFRRLASLERRARSGDRLGAVEATEISGSWGEPYTEGINGDRSAAWGSARAALEQDPRRALPLLRVVDREAADEVWLPQRDLLDSGPTDRHVVAETDDDGRTHLRFGDGVLGRTPDGGRLLELRYRLGNGLQGNVPAGAITHLARCSGNAAGITAIRNPLPASGGQDPEPVAEVKLMAPAAIRGSVRAVTDDDYAALASEVPGVQKAAAHAAWTGSWYEMQVGLDALDAQVAGPELIAQVDARLHRFRRIGHDLRVGQARRVNVDLALRVCVLPAFDRVTVRTAILEALGTEPLVNGNPAFFDPDRLTFGTDIHASAIVGIVQTIPGVESVTVTALQRQFEGDAGELDAGILELAALEVAQLDRTARTASGRLRLDMRGGR